MAEIPLNAENLTDRVREAADFLAVPAEAREVLQEAARRIAGSPEWIARLNKALPALLDDTPAEARTDFPLPEPAGSPESDCFYAVALLAGIDRPRRLHADLGVEQDISRSTLQDFNRWLEAFHAAHGRWGMDEIKWQSKFWRGKIFELGRLQFELSEYHGLARLYRSPDGPVALAEADVRVGPDGQALPRDAADVEGQVRTTLAEGPDELRGHRLRPDGCIEAQPSRFPAGDLRCRLRSGEPVLSVHIPAGRPLRHDDCVESYRRALLFFARHLPGFDWRAMVCHSWLMDPQLSAVLSPESNIAKFQADYHKLPNPDGEQEQIWERVFGARPASLDDAPRDSSLRRAILDHARAGGVWRFLSGVILREEVLERFGPACRCCRA